MALEAPEFLAYLWGIETQVEWRELRACDYVFSVPMRNWNATMSRKISLALMVFSVPMRNWNSSSAFLAAATIGVFSVPMRNWNSVFPDLPPKAELFLAYLWGIETWFGRQVQRVWHQVFSVPMRNWNFCSRSPNVRPLCVFSVPMRNWNLLSTDVIFSRFAFLAYLWGIETPSWQPQMPEQCIVFSVPMRNWNVITLGKYILWGGLFLAYLWGIETAEKIDYGRGLNSWFLAYLWGIET